MTLEEYFMQTPRAALAFSGGTDSAYLLWAAREFGCQVHAYYVKTALQPAFELEDAARLVIELGVPLTVLEPDILSVPEVRRNGADRCYHCKNALFGLIWEAALSGGFSVLMDGTNASDEAADRPGMRALSELSVQSPLRLCGITKTEVRARSRAAGLFTWNKPAYACLATRIPEGTELEAGALSRVEAAEAALEAEGFSDFRVRCLGRAAKLQLREEQMPLALEKRETVRGLLAPHFDDILLDLKPR